MTEDEKKLFEPDFLEFFDKVEQEYRGKLPINLLLDGYSSGSDQPFYYFGENFPCLLNHDLGMWLCWCNYYGRPRSEYPLARKLYPDMPEFTGIHLSNDAIV